MNREEMEPFARQLANLRIEGEACLILAVGACAPSMDCSKGSYVATVKVGNDTATSEAVALYDAIWLARGKCQRMAEARKLESEGVKRKAGRPKKVA